MRSPKTYLVLLLLPILCLLSPSACRQKPEQGSRMIRLIDTFDKSNILNSPLEHLKDNFEFVDEDLSEHWQEMKGLSDQETKVWAAVPDFKILGYDEAKLPEGMSLVFDGQDLSFYPHGRKDEATWKWKRGALVLPAIELKNYKRKLKCSVINSQKPVEFEHVFPGGAVEFVIYVKKAQARTPDSRLELSLDGRKVQSLEIRSTDYERIGFKIEVDANNYAVGLSTSKGVLHVKNVVIYAAHDLILLSLPHSETLRPDMGKSILHYPAQKMKASSRSPYSEEYLVSLLKEDVISSIPDLGVTSDLLHIKKKLVFEDVALNSLLAPPTSEFRFVLDIPADASLEFGYGILENSWEADSGPVDFEVFVKDLGTPQQIFSSTLFPAENEEHRHVNYEKIDISGYAGKKVAVQCITKLPASQNHSSAGPAPLAFWHNPVVFSKTTTAEKQGENEFNVILISLDTLRWDRLGCYGYERETSPHIDALAEDCVQFSYCFAQSNWTLPSHVSMLTSLNSRRHQVYLAHEKMSPSLLTIADILRVHGFYNGGITGGGYVSEKFGFSKGFDDYKGERYVFHSENEAEELGFETVDWVEKNADKRFFLFLHTYQIHDPYYNHPGITDEFVEGEVSWQSMPIASFLRNQDKKRKYEFSEKEQQDIVALYDGEIRYTDKYLIAPLLKKLKDLGLYDNTLIVLTSDHGEEFLDHGSWLHAHTLYNELIRVPLLIKYPRSKNKGKRIDTIVRSIDIVPTILEAAGIDPSPFDMDGKSLQKIVQGKEARNRVFFSDFSHKGSSDLRPSMVCTNRDFFKLILNRKPSPPKTFMFEMVEDVRETQNLEKAEAARLRQMFQSILDYYDNFKEVIIKSDQVIMDSALEERLKALGYIR